MAVFNPTKDQLRELVFLHVDETMAYSPDSCDQRPDPVVYPTPLLHDQRALWLDAVDAKFRDECVELEAYHRRRITLAARLLNEVRRNLRAKVLRIAQNTRLADAERNLAWASLQTGNLRSMAYLVMHLDEVRRWMLDQREEWLDTSPLAVEQRRYNVASETWRTGSDDQLVIYKSDVVELPDHAVTVDDTTTLGNQRQHGRVVERDGVGHAVIATNALSTSLDGQGFHRAARPPRKTKRWAFCAHCTELATDGDEVWYLTASKPGTARHSKKGCRRTESTPPTRVASVLQWVIRKTIRHGYPVTLIYLLTKCRQGWMTTSVSRYDHLGRQEFCDRPMEVASAVQSHAISALRRRKAKEIQARRAK